jgi:WD repeat-containing protein 7
MVMRSKSASMHVIISDPHLHPHELTISADTMSIEFKLPLTFDSYALHEPQQRYSSLNGSFATSIPTQIASLADASTVIVGCQDGTSYVFRQSQATQLSTPATVPTVQSPRPTSPMRPSSPLRASFGSEPTSRASSPSSMSHAPFNVSSRSRVVSGITKEQVEAPKNYVDFDDEPDKLKGMLRGKGKPGSHRNSVDGRGEENGSPSRAQSPNGQRRKEDPRARLSTTRSPSPTSKSIPASTRTTSFGSLKPEFQTVSHITPPSIGSEHSVSAIEIIPDTDQVVILQQSG